MTHGVLLTPGGSATPLRSTDGQPLADHLRAQLGQVGVQPVTVADDLAELARLAEAGRTPLLVCSADLVAHTAVLRHLATSPVGPTVALVLPDATGPGRLAVEEDRGQVVAVRTVPDNMVAVRTAADGTVPDSAAPDDTVTGGIGAASAAFGGALRIGVADLPALAAAARSVDAAGSVAPGAAGGGHTPAEGAAADHAADGGAATTVADPTDRLFAAFAATGTTIFTHRVRLLVARRVHDDAAVAAAEAAVAAVPSDPAELRLAVKERDDFFTTYFVSTWSPYVTRLAARLGLGPTQVTLIAVVFAVAAAALFGLGGRPALITGAVLLYLGFVLDCVDGQLARYTRQFSVWGGWLDTMADRAKEYIVYAGLAVGVERSGLGNGWALAIAAITLQTVRHMTDTWYGALHDEAARHPRAATGQGAGGPGGSAAGGLGDRLSRASTRVQADTGSVSYWLKRTVVFPIGERWALIALTVALFNPLVSLVAVLVWGGLAAAYTLALRTLRSRSMRVAVLSTVDATLHRDDGLPARLLGAVGSRLRWLPGPLPLAAVATASSAALLQTLVGGTGPDRRWAVVVALLVALIAALPSGRPQSGPLDWLVPAALRATEYLFLVAVGYGFGVPRPLIFTLLLVLALHHYNLTARLEKRERTPLLRSFGLGWDGRLILLTAFVMLGVGTVGFAVLAGYLFAISTLSAVTGWTVAARACRTEAGPEANDILVTERQRAG